MSSFWNCFCCSNNQVHPTASAPQGTQVAQAQPLHSIYEKPLHRTATDLLHKKTLLNDWEPSIKSQTQRDEFARIILNIDTQLAPIVEGNAISLTKIKGLPSSSQSRFIQEIDRLKSAADSIINEIARIAGQTIMGSTTHASKKQERVVLLSAFDSPAPGTPKHNLEQSTSGYKPTAQDTLASASGMTIDTSGPQGKYRQPITPTSSKVNLVSRKTLRGPTTSFEESGLTSPRKPRRPLTVRGSVKSQKSRRHIGDVFKPIQGTGNAHRTPSPMTKSDSVGFIDDEDIERDVTPPSQQEDCGDSDVDDELNAPARLESEAPASSGARTSRKESDDVEWDF